MSTATARLDTPSLTLPDWRTALKRRIKRPKLPDKGTLFNLAWNAGWVVFCAVELVVDQRPFWLALGGAWGCWFIEAVRIWRRGEPCFARNPQDATLRLTGWALWSVAVVLVLAGVGT